MPKLVPVLLAAAIAAWATPAPRRAPEPVWPVQLLAGPAGGRTSFRAHLGTVRSFRLSPSGRCVVVLSSLYPSFDPPRMDDFCEP